MSTSATSESSPRGSWGDWITDKALRGLIWCLLRLPLKTRLAVMSWVVRWLVAGPAGYRARALANLEHVWPDRPEAERRAIAEAALDNLGRLSIELFDKPGLRDRMAHVTPEGPGLAAIEAAKAEGRPILFVTGHYGNVDAPRLCMVARGMEVGGLFRPLANPYFNPYYVAEVSSVSGPAFVQGRRGTINLIRHLRDGGHALLLFDVYDSAGIPIPFLGKPAPTLTSAAEIALKSGAVMIPNFGIRNPDGYSFRAFFDAPVTGETAEEMTRDLTTRLERQIDEQPGQWIWVHRRWKPKRQRKRAAKAARTAL